MRECKVIQQPTSTYTVQPAESTGCGPRLDSVNDGMHRTPVSAQKDAPVGPVVREYVMGPMDGDTDAANVILVGERSCNVMMLLVGRVKTGAGVRAARDAAMLDEAAIEALPIAALPVQTVSIRHAGKAG